MWLLKFLPSWVFYFVVIGSSIGLLVSQLIPIQFRIITQAALAALVVFGAFMVGASYNEEKWKQRVVEVEKKVAEAENKSAIETIKIVDRVVYKKQVIHDKAEEVVKYIDREIVKYDVKFAPGGVCEIPKEFVEALNRAAE